MLLRRVIAHSMCNAAIRAAVMPGLVPGIHCGTGGRWIAGTSPAMTADLIAFLNDLESNR